MKVLVDALQEGDLEDSDSDLVHLLVVDDELEQVILVTFKVPPDDCTILAACRKAKFKLLIDEECALVLEIILFLIHEFGLRILESLGHYELIMIFGRCPADGKNSILVDAFARSLGSVGSDKIQASCGNLNQLLIVGVSPDLAEQALEHEHGSYTRVPVVVRVG